MAFGFPAYYRKELNVADLNDIRERLEKAITQLPFSILRRSNNQITLKVGWSVWSWGEKIIIDFSKPDTVSVVSKCISPLQFFDYGKNKENVELLTNRIQ